MTHPQTIAQWSDAYLRFERTDGKKDVNGGKPRERWTKALASRYGQLRLEDFNIQDAADFKQWVMNLPGKSGGTVSPATVLQALTYAQMFFEFPKEFGIFLSNPFAKISKPRAHPREERYSHEEIRILVSHCEREFADIVRFFLFTGLRRDEFIHLERRDIDFENNLIMVTGKGDRRAAIPMIAQARAILEGMKVRNLRYVFTKPDGEPLTRRYLQYHMARAKARAGIDKPGSLHILRHTAASWMIAAGVPLIYVQRIMRHTNAQTTAMYIHEDGETVRAAMEHGLSLEVARQ